MIPTAQPPLDGIVGLAILALIFVACWCVKRSLQKNNPASGRFYWWGNFIGAGAGVMFLIGWAILSHSLTSWSYLPLLFVPGVILGAVPGGVIGLIVGWILIKTTQKA